MRSLKLTLLFLLACDSSAPPAAAEPAAAEPSTKAAQPAPVPPPQAAAPALSSQARAGGLAFEHKAPLVRREPKSRMRAAEYGIEGDATSELAVFYFGPGQGGAVDSNLQRWLGQFTQPDGSDTAAKAKRSTRKVGEIEVALIEVTGTYGGGMAAPGLPPPPAISDALMLGAIANGPEGPLFFKLVGPKKAVESARAAFDQLIGSLRAAGAP